MAKQGDRRGGSKPGKSGVRAHVHNATAAAIIERLAGYGVPQLNISDFLNWAEEAIGLDLGGQGYSEDTLQRHYRDALNAAKRPSLDNLLQRAYAMAMMENIPDGVSADRAYAISSTKLMELLNIQHGIMPHQSHRLSGPNGGAIPISLIESVLSAEEIRQLADIMAKLEAAAERQ